MDFCILCVGSHGDILPYVALGVKLKEKGHNVYIASHEKARSLCQKYNLNFSLVGGDLTELGDSQKISEILLSSGFKKLMSLRYIMRLFRESLEQQLNDSLKAVQGADVLIYSPAAFAGPHLAEFYKIIAVRMSLQPELRTKQHPSCLISLPQFLGTFGNLLGHFLSDQMLWQPIRSQINRWRKKILNIRKMHILGPSSDLFSRKICSIVAFSSLLITRPSDWGSHIHMTGFSRISAAQNWVPTEALKTFLLDELAPVYIGFGSLSDTCPRGIVEKIVKVLTKGKIRALVQDTLPGIKEMKLPDHILIVNYVPHDWLFPRVRAVIHHGGVGTTAAGLYAGVPTLVMPFLMDQFFWGKKVFEWGVGPSPLSVKQCNETTFELSLNKLLDTHSYQERSALMREDLLKEEEGTEAAYQVLCRVL